MRFNFSFFAFAVMSAAACCVCITRPPSSVRCDSHGATAAAFQGTGISFVAAMNGDSACACLCAILNIIWTIATHTSSDFQKHPCNTQDIPIATVQQAANLTLAHILTTCTIRRNNCVPFFSTCDTRGISS